MRHCPRVDILGVGVSAINMEMALEAIEGWIERRECRKDPELRKIFNSSGPTTPDNTRGAFGEGGVLI